MKELTVDAAPGSLREIKAFIGDETLAAGCPDEARKQILIAADEVFTNIASYAYGGGEGTASVRFDVEPEPRAAVITFSDGGVPFDPLEMKAPDTSLSAVQRKIGGLGIFMVRKLMDDVSYKYEGGRNVLTVKKLF